MGAIKLKERVFDAGLCASCGGCAEICPYIRVIEDRVVMIEPCTLESGRCYDVCPRTGYDFEELIHEFFPMAEAHLPFGPHNSVYLARSKDERFADSGQYGGTVSALAAAALEMGLVQGVLGVKAAPVDNGLPLPEPVLLTDRDSILAAAGSKYQPVPSLALFNRLIEDEKWESLGVIGRPCQVTSLRRRQKLFEPQMKKLKLTIGLFCMWALDYRKLSRLVTETAGEGPIDRFDVPQGRCVIYRGDEKIEMPFDKVRELARPSCSYCYDFTAELADVSVGATEFDDKYNTLIVRNSSGSKLVDYARKNDLLEVKPFPEDKIALLTEAALGKKRKALKACDDLGGKKPIRVSAEEYNCVMEGADK
jgi:coenzyme F420 hydrogenase subunit beta